MPDGGGGNINVVYQTTYVVNNRVISASVAPSAPLSTYAGMRVFVFILYRNVQTYIDLNSMLLLEQNIDLTETVSYYLSHTLNDLKVAGYGSSDFPVIDLENGKYDHRLNAYDALSAEDLNIDYTSIIDPTVKNDVYQRATLNDLLLSSNTRDFTNSLVSVNGVLHATQLFQNQLFVLNGFANIRNNEPRGKKIGIYDTTSLGGHTVIPLNLNQVVNTPSQDPTKGIYLYFEGANFTGKTILLSLGGYLYALDDSYEIVGTNRIKLNINKMDLINQFMHNPNTIYRDKYGSLAFNIHCFGNSSLTPTDPRPRPTVQQEILYFLNNQFPALLESQTAGNPAMLTQYSYTDLYSFIEEIIETLKLSELMSPAFVYKILAEQSSFLIVINNPSLYVRTYPLVPEFAPSLYQAASRDMPRGILRYNKNKIFPYVILSGSTDHRHLVSIDYVQEFADVYKTAYMPSRIPSPWFDVKDWSQRFPVELFELYAAQ